MASSKTRARRLARAKLHRQLARQAEQQRRSRQIRAGLAVGLAVVLAGLGTAWLLGAFDKKETPTAQTQCEWTKQDVAANPDLADKGTPVASGLPDTGTATMTMALGTGTVQVALDRAGATCGAASLRYLADQNYYNNTTCFSLTHTDADGYALTCGDHTGKGTGGAAYTFFAEQPAPEATATPAASASASAAATTKRFYKAGTVVMDPAVSGSQFLIFYKDSTVDATLHNYSVVGEVTTGLQTVDAIARAGTVKNDQGADVKPKNEVKIQTLTVADTSTSPAAQPTGSATPTGSAAPTATTSASAS